MSKFLICILTLAISTSLQALVILPPATSAGSEMGKAFGDGLNRGMQQGFAEAAQRRQAEEQQRRQLEALAQAEAAMQKENARCSEILQNILKNYDPAKTPEYVSKILQSSLPDARKNSAIVQLNETYKLHLQQKNKKKK